MQQPVLGDDLLPPQSDFVSDLLETSLCLGLDHRGSWFSTFRVIPHLGRVLVAPGDVEDQIVVKLLRLLSLIVVARHCQRVLGLMIVKALSYTF